MSGRDQVLEFIARLMTKTPWSKVDGSVLQLVINEIDRVIPEFMQFLANGGRCTPEAPEAEVVPPVPEPTIEVLDIKVDKTRTVAELIAAGKYGENCVDSNITDLNFPLGPIPEGKELVRVRFNRHLANRDAVIAERKKLALEPVTSIAFILTVGADKPDLQEKAPISDIDSVWSHPGGRVHFPFLWSDGHERGFCLYWDGNDFLADEWILALRNITPKS